MTLIDKAARAELIREVATALAQKQRLSFASDFHAFAEGRALVLAGVPFEGFPKGPNTKRSDGDVVAHAIVMALAGATDTGDIDDWFPDTGEVGRKSLEYLAIMRRDLLEAKHFLVGVIDITIISGEQPRMKKRIPEMRRNIAEGLGIRPNQVQVKVSSMDGHDEIAQLEGIEARVLLSLWEGL